MKTVTKNMQAAMVTLLVSVTAVPAFAGAQSGGGDVCAGRADVLIGQDNDNESNRVIQSVATPNQSLNNADVLLGEDGCDILIGLQGNDVLDGGAGSDIMIGGTEQFDPEGFGNKDVMLGGNGNDTNLWAPGDGSDAFIGGFGLQDAQVFGLIDRDSSNVPVLTPVNGIFSETGVPTANVSGSPGFCTLDDVEDTDLGFDYLVRFFVRATGNLAVTIRLKDVEQVFCTSEAGGEITYADLTAEYPSFEVVSALEVEELNPTVNRIIR